MPITTTGRATDFITFSRTSNATVTGADGRIRWAGHNLLTNSESFDGWTTNYGVTVTANAIAAPNGTTTADRLVEQAINDTHFIGQNDRITTPSNTLVPHTLAVFAKADQRQYLNLSIEWSTNYVAATFDLSGGTVTSNRAGGTGTGNTSTITAVGSGWYLCTLTGILGTAGSNGAVISISDVAVPTGSKASYLGNTSNGLYIWGAHLYRSDLGGMVLNPARGDAYYPTTPRNLLGYSNFTTGWTTQLGAVITPNNIASPDGLNTGARIALGADALSAAFQNVTGFGTYTVSAWLRGDVGGETVKFAYYNATNGLVQSSAITLTNAWVRYSWTASPTASSAWYITNTAATAKIVYAWGAQLSDSASLDAYSPVYGAAVASAAYYAPRLDYDPVTLAANGLLVEEQRTNLLTYSAQFDDAAWEKKGTATATGNTTASPDGTTNADTIAGATSDVASSSTNSIERVPTVSSSTAYTFSLYVRSLGSTTCRIALRDASTGNVVFADLVPTTSWQRMTVTMTTGAATTQMNVRIGGTNGNIAIYGAQLEAGSFATSYIPTGAATATRTADVASVSTQAFPYSATEGTLVGNFSFLGGSAANASNQTGAALRDTSASSAIYLYNGGGKVSAYCVLAGVDQAYMERNTVAAGVSTKLAFAFKANDFAASQDGGAVATDPSGSLPSPNVLALGSTGTNTGYLNGHIRQITYLPRRISNAELQSRSA